MQVTNPEIDSEGMYITFCRNNSFSARVWCWKYIYLKLTFRNRDKLEVLELITLHEFVESYVDALPFISLTAYWIYQVGVV